MNKKLVLCSVLCLTSLAANAGIFDLFNSDKNKPEAVKIDGTKVTPQIDESKNNTKLEKGKEIALDNDFSYISAHIRHMNQQMNAMFDDFFNDFGKPTPNIQIFSNRIVSISPRVDAFAKDGKFQIVADLPGLSKEEIEVSTSDNYITIKSEQKKEKKTEDTSYYLSERSYGYFSRTIALPKGVNTDKAETEFKDGVLKISMPMVKITAPTVKKLTIK